MTTLELLHALTEADGKATGPSAWSSWKGALVDELVTAVAARLGGAPPIDRRWQLDPGLQALVDEAAGDVLVRPQGSTVVIVSPDRPGLFCKLAGVLCLHGLEVLTADVRSAGGTAVDSFVFHRPAGEMDWDRFRGDLERALDGSLDLDTRHRRTSSQLSAAVSRRRPAGSRTPSPSTTTRQVTRPSSR